MYSIPEKKHSKLFQEPTKGRKIHSCRRFLRYNESLKQYAVTNGVCRKVTHTNESPCYKEFLCRREHIEHCFFHMMVHIHRVSQEECTRLREGVPYGKVYQYNPKHLCSKLNGYGDNGQRKVWSTCGSIRCTYQLTSLSMSVLECGMALRHCLPVICHVQVLGNLRSITTCLRVVL
jgi:hypothetical protein